VMVGLCWRMARVAKKIGTKRSWPHGKPYVRMPSHLQQKLSVACSPHT
jgi:hypothetical protein